MKRRLAVVCCVVACADGTNPGGDDRPAQPLGFQAPVVTNAVSPVDYPPELYERGIEGTVILRLFVDASGILVADSTRIEETSGYPELDSAALAGVGDMQFAPALRDQEPVATIFLQPVHFRQPGSVNEPTP